MSSDAVTGKLNSFRTHPAIPLAVTALPERAQ